MESMSCPIPQVGEALAPYIRTRQEASRIRQTIFEFVKGQVRHETTPPTHLSLTTPAASLQVSPVYAAQDGIYRRYLEALAAHQAARDQYDSLKAELTQLKLNVAPQHVDDHSTGLREYVDLLQRRQAVSKLEIVQSTFAQIQEVASSSPPSLDARSLLKAKLGDAPQPPPEGVNRQGDVAEKVDSLIFKLKKELLLAKSSLDKSTAIRLDISRRSASDGEPSPAAEIAALKAARAALISWIEGELAKVPEDSSEVSNTTHVDDTAESETDDTISPETIQSQVRELYDLYIETRKNLLFQLGATTSRLHHLDKIANTTIPTETMPHSSSAPRTDHALAANDILPLLVPLLSDARAEALLLQQSSHLRRQLLSNADDTTRVIQRLAGESYLVPADTSSMITWASAVRAAADKGDSSVLEQVEAGMASVDAAEQALDRMVRRREMVDGLRGDV